MDSIPKSGRQLRDARQENPSPVVTEAFHKYGGFYLGSTRAARLAKDCIKKVEVLEYPELEMEAVFPIEVVDFLPFIMVDDKGKDFFA
jgi:fumarate hydratase, class I